MNGEWIAGPSGVTPKEAWLYRVDEQDDTLVALIDPFSDAPADSDGNVEELGRWRLAEFALCDDDLSGPLAGVPEPLRAMLPEPLGPVASSALGRDARSVVTLTCAEVLRQVDDEALEWVCGQTEESLIALQAMWLGPGQKVVRRGMVTEADVDRARRSVDRLNGLLAEWESSGGRILYLKQLVSSVEQRRARLLEVMDSTPTSPAEWKDVLTERCLNHLGQLADGQDVNHSGADVLAWTAAMALEAAWGVRASKPEPFTLDMLIDDAAHEIEDVVQEPRSVGRWLHGACRTLTSKSFDDDADSRFLEIYASVSAAIITSGRVSCAREHDDDDLSADH